jgi:hypothetical protein
MQIKASWGVAKFGYNSPAGKPLRTAVRHSRDRVDRLRGKYNSISREN